MSKVYYKKCELNDEVNNIVYELITKIIKENEIKLPNMVPIKVHFGEEGNETYLPAITYDQIIDYLQSKNVETAFIETNVLYRGLRTNRSAHIKLALDHGFTKIPIIIADGENGECYHEVEINKTLFQKCFIGAEFKNYDQYVICSHFKGHCLSGFGGAIKQLGMGFAARGGKLAQHSHSKPKIQKNKCTQCGICLLNCSSEAIDISNSHINHEKCNGCAICISICPLDAISFDWQASHFNQRLAEYALAASIGKRNIYINFIANITNDCDCMGHKMDIIAKNIGVLASLDPVAIDTASLDLLQKNEGQKLFDSGRSCLTHACNIGLGSMGYELVKI